MSPSSKPSMKSEMKSMPSSSRLGRACIAVAAALLAACTVGPDYQRPQAPETTAYTSEPLASLHDGSGQKLAPGSNPDADWWSGFHSAALDSTMQQALAGNHGLAAAQATLEQARETANASAGSLYPQVSLDAGAGRQKYGAQFLGAQAVPAFTYYSVGPSVSYLLDYTGGQHRAVEQQQALADYQAFQLQAAHLSLTGNVAQQAFAIASARAQIAAAQELLDEDRKNLSLVQTAFAAGSVTRVDVLSAQSQLANDQTLLPPLRQQLSVARHALSILAGKAPADWISPDFDLDQLQLPQTLPLNRSCTPPLPPWESPPRTSTRRSISPPRQASSPLRCRTCSMPPAPPGVWPPVSLRRCSTAAPCARSAAARRTRPGPRWPTTSRPCCNPLARSPTY